jgi:hypothetical protein
VGEVLVRAPVGQIEDRLHDPPAGEHLPVGHRVVRDGGQAREHREIKRKGLHAETIPPPTDTDLFHILAGAIRGARPRVAWCACRAGRHSLGTARR